MLCSSCLILQADAQAKTPVGQKNQKGIFSDYVNKTKAWGSTYKTKLERKYYKERIKQTPYDVEILKSYADFLKNHKYYDEAIKAYSKLIELTKNDRFKKDIAEIKSYQIYTSKEAIFSQIIKQAQGYESSGQIAKANKYYLKAYKILPNRFEARFGLAKTYGWLGNSKQATKYYKELLNESPNNINLLETYADYLKSAGNYGDSAVIYVKLFALTNNVKYQANLSEIAALQKGNIQKPNGKGIVPGSKEDKSFSNYIIKAQSFESNGKISKANQYYLKAQKIYPDRQEAIFGLAKTYGWLGQDIVANSYYKKLLSVAPNNPDFVLAYNKFLKETKASGAYQKQKAMKYQTRYPPVNQEKNRISALFSDYLKQAQSYESQGKAAEANEFYLKAQKLDPYRYEVKFGLAKTYGWLHNDKLAMKYYKELLVQTPDNTDLLEAYAGYLKDTKNYSQAMQIYEKLLAQTSNEKYSANIAEVYFLRQDYQTSLNLYMELYNKNLTDPNLQKAIGLLYFVLGDFDNSICFYQKYLSQVQDAKSVQPESILNYAKSLFYTKQIQPAKDILEAYVKAYPNDAEGLSTLADIYVTEKNLPCAMQLVSQAIILEPDKIKYKIQSAKIDIYAKNYAQAQCLLLQLAQIEPNNTDILESLGDIAYSTGDFKQALRYFQCVLDQDITDPKYCDKIHFKIAQAHQYNKEYALAERLYKPFVKNPEYANRAKIGIAEIKISEDLPVQARKILNNVLANDPDNVQAKKNLAIAYYSTGDNLTSIDILKSLPKNDDDITDINYNMAKAYNEIERKDLALDLLRDNPQENAKTLKGEILMQVRPTAGPLYDFYYMNPNNGNVNAGKYQKAGANAYYYIKPNLRVVATGTNTLYSNLNNLVSTTGTLGSIGLEGKPTNHVSFRSAIGYMAFNDNGQNNLILGNLIFKTSPNDVMTFTTGYIRSLDEIDSYMSAAGVVPSVGPFANQLVGRIVDNKYVFGVAFKLPKRFYAYAGMNVGNKYGSNSPSNFYREIPMGLGKVVYSAPEKNHINQVLLGYDFYYTGYNYDRSGFGGANLAFSPVGSDGGAIDPSSGFPATGGYFSPTFFIANKFPITFKGSFKNSKLKYIISAFIGTQTIEGQIGLVGPTAGGPSNITTTPYYGYAVGLRYNEKGRVVWGIDYTFNNYMTVAQHLLRTFLLVRF